MHSVWERVYSLHVVVTIESKTVRMALFPTCGRPPTTQWTPPASVSPTAIKDANEAVRNTLELSRSTESREYVKFTPAQQAPIGEYASMHGNQAAIRHFSKVLGVEIKGSSVQTWKGKYLAEVSRKRKAGDMNDLTVTCLPVKKRGRPLLLGEKLDTEVQSYIRAVREGGGPWSDHNRHHHGGTWGPNYDHYKLGKISSLSNELC